MYGDIDPDDYTADGEPFDDDAALNEATILRQQEAADAETANGPDLIFTGDDFPF
jgi:hypothetical protein